MTSRLEHWLRSLWLAPRILMRYGTLYPEKVNLPHAAGSLHIDPHDARARKKCLYDAVRNRYWLNRRFWNEFITALQPTLALDIGANYGECVFSPRYTPATRAVAFEANPGLMAHLSASRDMHPDRDRILVVNALIDRASSGPREFFVDTRWSGGSTAVPGIAHAMDATVTELVDTLSIDSWLTGHPRRVTSLVFKVDVEGFEPNVLLGMRETLHRVDTAAGFVECNIGYLRKAGWEPATYQHEALSGLDIYAPDQRGRLPMRRIDALSDYLSLQAERGKPGKDVHVDLLLIKSGSDISGLPPGWIM